MQLIRALCTAPNLVSLVRLLMAPILLWLAYTERGQWFLLAVAFCIFTDLLDGFLARWLKQITELGSRLDSWGDFTVYSTLAIGAWLLWPETVMENIFSSTVIVLSFTLPSLIGLIKFKGLTSYHTWLVKLAVAATIIAYLLLFSGVLTWPYHLAAALCAVAAIEETAITLVLRKKRADVRSIFRALQDS